METINQPFTKQYANNQISISLSENDDLNKAQFVNGHVQSFEIRPNIGFDGDQPIDLTFGNNSNGQNVQQMVHAFNKRAILQGLSANHTIIPFSENQPKRKFKKRKIPFYQANLCNKLMSKDALNKNENVVMDSKHMDEVLKAAKSLFSKRTRTLYHWLHPSAPKQQIKTAVATSWESLGAQEKEFYISQVLGRFGFPQGSLMINPQLGGIKQLPPLPELTEFNRPPSTELQNAISSISVDGPFSMPSLLDRNLQPNVIKRKKRLGRPPGSKNRKLRAESRNIAHDFQDDPELNQELQQFAINLNMSQKYEF